MRIDIRCDELKKENKGLEALIKVVAPSGRTLIDLKKKLIIVENFPKASLEKILLIIKLNFDFNTIELNGEKKFKIPNEEKIIEQKKGEMVEEIKKSPKSLTSKVKQFILEEKVFTLVDLKKKFPKNNEGSLRSCVNNMKKEGLLHEIRPGKYCLL